jgi:DNA invertase Pin-like site-specific DNA recombinase
VKRVTNPKGYEVIRHRGGHSQLIGYARVSRADQELRSQLDALKAAGCSKVYAERVSSVARRLGYEALLEQARKGDTIVVTRLDRLGRKMLEVVHCANELGERGVHLRATLQGIDTGAAHGKHLLPIWAALAEMERELLRERTREGLDAARARGRVPGRRLLLTPAKRDQCKHLSAQKHSVRAIAEAVKLSPTSVRRALEDTEPRRETRQLALAVEKGGEVSL